MRTRTRLTAVACSLALALAPIPAIAADTTTDTGSSISSSDSKPTKEEREKARLAMTYGSTDKESAEECAKKLHKGPGIHTKEAVPEDCSWVETTSSEVADAWLHVGTYPGEAFMAIAQNLLSIGLVVGPMALLALPFLPDNPALPQLPPLPKLLP